MATRKKPIYDYIGLALVAGAALVAFALFVVAIYALTGEPLPDAAALVRRGALGVWGLLVPWGLLIPAALLLWHFAPNIAGALDAERAELRKDVDELARLLDAKAAQLERTEAELRRANQDLRFLLAEYEYAGGPEQETPSAARAAEWLRREAVAGRLAIEHLDARQEIIEHTSAQLVRAVEERDEARRAERRALVEREEARAALAALRAEYDAPVQCDGAGVQGFIAAASASPRRGIAPLAKLYRAHVGPLDTNNPAMRSLFSALISLLPSPEDASRVEALTEGEGAAGAGEGAERADGLNAERATLNAEREGVEG